MVMEALKAGYDETLDTVRTELETPNSETVLSRARSLAGVIGKTKVHDLYADGYQLRSLHMRWGRRACADRAAGAGGKLPGGAKEWLARCAL